MTDPEDRTARGTAATSRFAKTAAAAASSRPLADDQVPWTHAPAQNAGQGGGVLRRWLRRWLGLGAGGDDGGRDPAAPRTAGTSTRRRPPVGGAALPAPAPDNPDVLAQVVPRRPGAQTRARWSQDGDDGDRFADDPGPARPGPEMSGRIPVGPTRRVRATADRVVRPGRPQHRRTFGRG